MNIYLTNFDKKIIKSIIDKCHTNDRYHFVFVGHDPSKKYQLKNLMPTKAVAIEFAHTMGALQYKLKDKYYNFIDEHESNSGKQMWWSSWLSWKNPWISNFYLRFTQIHAIKEELQSLNDDVILVVENRAVSDILKVNLSQLIQFHLIDHTTNFKFIPDLVLNGIKRRLLSFPKLVNRRLRFSFIFSKLSLSSISIKSTLPIILLPTFLDHRSFRSGYYKDSFLGKVSTLFDSTKYHIVFIPIIAIKNKSKLNQFKSWLQKNDYLVEFPFQAASIFTLLKFTLLSLFKGPNKVENLYFDDLDVSKLINLEEREEWSRYTDLFRLHAQEVCHKISKFGNDKILIYPFENQHWERIFLNELRINNVIKCIAIQNAPCPMLSTRFYFSKSKIDDLPLPDHLIVNGKISMSNLSDYYKDHIQLHLGMTSRPLTQSKSISVINSKILMICCSGEVQESQALILFVSETLKSCKDWTAFVVPHPLVNYNYAQFLKQIEAPANCQISSLKFDDIFDKSEIVVFDSSSVGLESLLNGKTSIFIGHQNTIHVNPSEFDSEFTLNFYKVGSLVNFLKSYKLSPDKERMREKSLEYYNLDSDLSNVELISKIIE